MNEMPNLQKYCSSFQYDITKMIHYKLIQHIRNIKREA